MTVIIAGPSPGSRKVAEGISTVLDAELVYAQSKVFPDGERYVRVPEDIDDDVVIVQTLSPPQDSSLVEAMLLANASKGAGASRAVLVAPYMAYSRQDKRFLPGEPISIEVVLGSLASSGYDAIVTVEIHKEESLNFFPGKSINVRPYKYMAEKISPPSDTLVLAPDLGAIERAQQFAEAIGAQYDYLIKKRDRMTGEIVIEPKTIAAKNRHVVIVDDIISTGGTIARAATLLLQQGASTVEVVVAHALLAGDAVEKLKRSGIRRVYAANTLPPKHDPLIQYIDVSSIIAENLKQIL